MYNVVCFEQSLKNQKKKINQLKIVIFTVVKNRNISLPERLRSHKVSTKDQSFYLNYHKFSKKSYVLDVY